MRWGLHPDMLHVFETVIFRLDDAYMRQEQARAKRAKAAAEREAQRNGPGKRKIR